MLAYSVTVLRDLFFFSLNQRTPLHMAVKGGHLDIVEQLVNSDADINIKDNKGVCTISELGLS